MPRFGPLRILYYDDAIICFDKPAGLPTHPTIDKARENLYSLALQQLSKEQTNVYLGIHHRLDRDTSGVILFTRLKEYNSYFSDLFKNHQCIKTYVAVVHGKPIPRSGKIESYLSSVEKKSKKTKFGSVHSGGKQAITQYTVLVSNEVFSLVKVEIKTGRTHQIRVHFSEKGHPIVGDTLYGSPLKYFQKYKRHLLHAHALSFKHPVTQNILRIESPIPEVFRKCVS